MQLDITLKLVVFIDQLKDKLPPINEDSPDCILKKFEFENENLEIKFYKVKDITGGIFWLYNPYYVEFCSIVKKGN